MVQSHYTTEVSISAGNRIIGNVKDGIFHKTIKPNHYLKYPVKSIAFDVQSLKDAEQSGASKVQVKDTQTGVIYKASIAQIWRAGFRFNRGFGDQIALELSAYTRQGQALQLDLFASGVGA